MVQGACHHQLRPAPFVNLIGSEAVHGCQRVTLFCFAGVQTDEHFAAATFLRTLPAAFVGNKMFQKGEQEGTELAALILQMIQPVAVDKPAEKFLREILRVLHTVSRAAQVGIDRGRVNAAQLFERLFRLAGTSILRREHDAPMGRLEDAAMNGCERGRVRFHFHRLEPVMIKPQLPRRAQPGV